MKKERDLKVYEMSGYKYKGTPTIMLKGDWLKEFGFDAGRQIRVECDNERIIITAKEITPEPVTEAPRRRKVKGR